MGINRFFGEIDSRQTKIFRYFSRSFIGNGGVAERSNAADCKSALYEFDGSNPSPTTILTGAKSTGFFCLYGREPSGSTQAKRREAGVMRQPRRASRRCSNPSQPCFQTNSGLFHIWMPCGKLRTGCSRPLTESKGNSVLLRNLRRLRWAITLATDFLLAQAPQHPSALPSSFLHARPRLVFL